MSFLDKLKPAPRWKHADPAIRLDAVRELDDPAELATLAETDPDTRVRRAAAARVDDPAVLGRLANASAEAEASLRDLAADRLVALASHADGDGATALAAVRALNDPRRLSSLAKSDTLDAVREDALARVTDARALGSISRHAKHESTALAALARLADHAELVDVVVNAESKEVAMGAFDRVVAAARPDLALLRSIEARAQQKVVSRRARTMIQELEEAEAAARAALEDRRRREAALAEGAEQLASVTDIAVARVELARLRDAWQGLGSTDAAAAARFDAAVAAADGAIARRTRDAEDAVERARARAEAIATRDALCVRVETLDGDDALSQLVPIEEEWRSLLPLVGNGPEADRLAERFAQAVAACRKRHALGAVLVETRAKFEALVGDAEQLAVEAASAPRWQALAREARGLTATLSDAGRPVDDLATRLGVVSTAFAALDAAAEQAALKVRLDAVAQLVRLGDRAKRVSDADTITLREGERLMRDIGTALEGAGAIAEGKDLDDAVARLKTLQEQIAPRVRELREMDDWRRFANAQRQEQLIAMAEAIVLSLKSDEEQGKTSDLAATARALRELHTKWQEAAEAPRNSAQRLWDRFRTATDTIRARCEGYFAKLREERHTSLEKKNALVVEAEALAQSTDWGKAAGRFKDLQTEWQALGPVAREAGRDLAHRFRTASNAFFARRREDLTDRKKTWSENLTKKEALCARAEELASSTEWDAASAEMKKLQADWKTVGPVRRNKSEQVWTRFRAAADKFFERYHNRHDITLANKLAEREALVVELETMAASDAATLSGDAVQQLRTTWNRAVPIPAAGMKVLSERWQAALARVVSSRPELFAGTDLDPAAVHQRMAKLVARVEALGADVREAKPAGSPTEQLAARLRSAFASNAMGGRSSEDAKLRAAAEAVKEAQAAWQRLAPVDDPEARAFEARFREACRRIQDLTRQRPLGSGGGTSQPPRRPGRPTAAMA